jgi:hypothetical protein
MNIFNWIGVCFLSLASNYAYAEEVIFDKPSQSCCLFIDGLVPFFNIQNMVEISKLPVIKLETVSPVTEENDFYSKEWITVYLSAGLTFITLVLAFYTFRLWQSTNQVVQESRKASQNQLRAYVNIMGVGTSPHKDKQLAEIHGSFPAYFDLAIKNWGQTPAHKLIIKTNFHTVPYGESLPVDFNFPDKIRERAFGQQNQKIGMTVLAPGNNITYTMAFNADELNDIQRSMNNEINLFVYGAVKYEDIFNIERVSLFCYLIGHFAHGDFSPFTIYHDHNNAT